MDIEKIVFFIKLFWDILYYDLYKYGYLRVKYIECIFFINFIRFEVILRLFIFLNIFKLFYGIFFYYFRRIRVKLFKLINI